MVKVRSTTVDFATLKRDLELRIARTLMIVGVYLLEEKEKKWGMTDDDLLSVRDEDLPSYSLVKEFF